jgi:hypothetical protein
MTFDDGAFVKNVDKLNGKVSGQVFAIPMIF